MSGSSAMRTGIPVSRSMRSEKPRRSAPPPATTMPSLVMSAASSGGASSSVSCTAAMISATGGASAEQIKLAIASAEPLPQELRTRIRGRDLMSGLPREIELDSIEVRTAIEPAVAAICEAVHDTLEETPPELAADITKEGILLAGGGSLLPGLIERVHRETGMPVRMAESPLTCVAEGAGMSLEELDTLGARGRDRRRY